MSKDSRNEWLCAYFGGLIWSTIAPKDGVSRLRGIRAQSLQNKVSFRGYKGLIEMEENMNKLIANGALAVGVLGALLTVTAGIWRITGHYHLAGFEVMTLFVGGMGLMLIGCFALLHLLLSTR